MDAKPTTAGRNPSLDDTGFLLEMVTWGAMLVLAAGLLLAGALEVRHVNDKAVEQVPRVAVATRVAQ